MIFNFYIVYKKFDNDKKLVIKLEKNCKWSSKFAADCIHGKNIESNPAFINIASN